MNKHYICELKDGSFRDSTNKEIKIAKLVEKRRIEIKEEINNLNKELKEIEDNCPHNVSYDEAGYVYDIRHCVSCARTKSI